MHIYANENKDDFIRSAESLENCICLGEAFTFAGSYHDLSDREELSFDSDTGKLGFKSNETVVAQYDEHEQIQQKIDNVPLGKFAFALLAMDNPDDFVSLNLPTLDGGYLNTSEKVKSHAEELLSEAKSSLGQAYLNYLLSELKIKSISALAKEERKTNVEAIISAKAEYDASIAEEEIIDTSP